MNPTIETRCQEIGEWEFAWKLKARLTNILPYMDSKPIRAGEIIVKYIMNVWGYAEMAPFHELTQQYL